MLKHLDICSGIGGFALAARWVGGIETVGFIELDPFCSEVLGIRFPGVPRWPDVRAFSGSDIGGPIDLVTAGFPCQDISMVNRGRVGLVEGERSSLFFEILRVIEELSPSYVLLENVEALITSDKGRDAAIVIGALARLGYEVEWKVIAAAELGAVHWRKRAWIVAHKDRGRLISRDRPSLSSGLRFIVGIDDFLSGFDAPVPGNAASKRLKALGNSIVPQVATIPLAAIVGHGKRGFPWVLGEGKGAPLAFVSSDGWVPAQGVLWEDPEWVPRIPPSGAVDSSGALLSVPVLSRLPGVPTHQWHLPTPTASQAGRGVSTSSVARGPNGGFFWARTESGTRSSVSLGSALAFLGRRDLAKSPDFAESMMGYPSGWTNSQDYRP